MTSRPLTPEKYYRLPWNLADNAITWLEPTTKCNIYCEGCYRENNPEGDRPLEEVIKDLEAIKGLRRTDGISIAGGEPLIYPHIIELVKYVAEQGWKPIIITNGQNLTPELLKELYQAGVRGFTVHVDSHQNRPNMAGLSETDLNAFRLEKAQMIAEAGRGRIFCAFNATIYRDTLKDVPMLTKWAQEHMKLVQTMVFILYRSARQTDEFAGFVRGKEIDPTELVYQLDSMEDHEDVVVQEVADQIRTVCPEYEPNAYLNGTMDPSTMKWLLAVRSGNRREMIQYHNPALVEMAQVVHHLIKGTYMAYSSPFFMRHAKFMFLLALVNKGVRKLLGKCLIKPWRLFMPLHTQAMMIIQPPDILEDGRQNMCDGCPDGFYYEGRFIWKCRLDELEKYGDFVITVPKEKVEADQAREANGTEAPSLYRKKQAA
ncbi:MAG: radical SAM protein [Deltaproteobacteria bacterium]|nr:radical SAM protein [Deltaproteobacteria bacterium]